MFVRNSRHWVAFLPARYTSWPFPGARVSAGAAYRRKCMLENADLHHIANCISLSIVRIQIADRLINTLRQKNAFGQMWRLRPSGTNRLIYGNTFALCLVIFRYLIWNIEIRTNNLTLMGETKFECVAGGAGWSEGLNLVVGWILSA